MRAEKTGRSVAKDIAYVGLGTALIAVCAWISVPVGAVPFTLQTFAVAAVGGLLGWKRGTLAVLAYLLLGLAGVPVFSGFKAGVPALMGPTGGYILGFVLSVAVTGFAKLLPVKNRAGRTAVFYAFMILGNLLCYLFGTVWFLIVYNGGTATPVSVGGALLICVVPYILPDLIKLAIAAFLSVRLERFVL